MKKQTTLRIEESLLEKADRYVDGVHFRSRANVFEVAIDEYMKRHRPPRKKQDRSFDGGAEEDMRQEAKHQGS